MAREPNWLNRDAVLAMHSELVAEHGGADGIRDDGLFDSALARPQNAWAYSSPRPSRADCAASLCFGLAKNHAFVDGNKRIALAAAAVFLEINGYELDAPEVEAAAVIQDVAAGKLTESALAAWFEKNSRRLK